MSDKFFFQINIKVQQSDEERNLHIKSLHIFLKTGSFMETWIWVMEKNVILILL